MINNILKSKKIGILGLAQTGLSCYKFLVSQEKSVICFDDNVESKHHFIKFFDKSSFIDINDNIWETMDCIIISPGVPLYYPNIHKIVSIAQKANIPIISDIDLFYSNLKNKHNIIGITGTNGKSTTTSLTTHILNKCNLNFSSGGNIGIACLDLPKDKPGYVLELSSFQLDLIKSLKLKIAILLNITPDHLNRYKNYDEYKLAKFKIFNLLSEDGIAIIDFDNLDEYLTNIQGKNHTIFSFSTKNSKSSVYVENYIIYDNISNIICEIPYNVDLQGEHNKQNIAASYLTSLIMGCTPNNIISTIKSFKGLPYRFQYIGQKNNIHFYNDSKATNFAAASKAIASLDNIYWIAGGINKSNDLEYIKDFKDKITKAYFYGASSQQLAKYFHNIFDLDLFDNLNGALTAVLNDTKDVNILTNVLLAPGCSSYDQFKDYKDRGKQFLDLCLQFINS